MNFLKLFLVLVTIFSVQVLSDNQQVLATSETSFFLNSGGSGIEGDPYLISSAEEFLDFKDMIDSRGISNDVFYKLANDIDLDNIPMDSIGRDDISFNGVFDGDNHKILNINLIETSDNNSGLFINSNGVIKNLEISNGIIQGSVYAGAIVANNFGVVDNCINNANVTASLNVGGIVRINNGLILNCINNGTLISGSYVAGIAVENYGTIDNCVNSGSITSESDGSGITISNKNILKNCINYGTVSSRAISSGIVIYNYDLGSIDNSINSAKILSKFNSATGIVFNNIGNISNVINMGSVYSYNYPWSATAGLVLNNAGKLKNGFDLGGVNTSIEWINNPDHYSAYYTNTGEVTDVYYLYDFNDRIDQEGSIAINVEKMFTYNNERMIVGDIHKITNSIPDLSSLATEGGFGTDFNIFIEQVNYDQQYLSKDTYSLKALNDGNTDIKIKLTVSTNNLVAGSGFSGEVTNTSFEKTYNQTIIQFPTISLDNDLEVKKYGDISEFNINSDGVIYLVSNKIVLEDPKELLDMNNSGILKKTVTKNDINQFTKITLDEGEYTAYLYANELFSEVCDKKITIVSQFSNGDGSVDNPYWISDVEDLRKIDYSSLEHSETLYYILKNDLDFSGIENWEPIDADNIYFDGAYHVITNLTVDSDELEVRALFSYFENSVVKRVGVVDATINGGEVAGVLSGESYDSYFEEVFVSGNVAADYIGGGIIGVAEENNVFLNCFSMVDIKAIDIVGGFVGIAGSFDINNCYSASIVTETVRERTTKGSREPRLNGFVGYIYDESIVNSSNYYDKDLFVGKPESSLGRSTKDMKSKSTYKKMDGTSWDYDDVWSIHNSVNGGYPYLKNFKYFSDQYVKEESTNNSEVIANPVVVEKPQPKNIASKKTLGKTIELIGIPEGDLNKKITVSASTDAFDTSVEVVIKSDEDTRKQIEDKLGDLKNLNILPMDITVYKKGTTIKLQPTSGSTVSIRYPIPEDMLEDMENIQVVCINGDQLEYLDSTIVEIDGVYFIEFEAEHFSPYALLLSKSTNQVVEETTVDTVENNEVIVEDEIVTDYSVYIIGLVLVIIAGAVLVIKNKKK
jgi:hypothetical protein